MRKFRYNHALHNKIIEKDILDGMEGGDINSREELLQIAKEEGLNNPINWQKWDELVQITKQIIKENIKDNKRKPQNRKPKPVWVYDLKTGKQIGHYESPKETVYKMKDINKSTISRCLCQNKPYLAENLFFSYQQLEQEQVTQHKTNYSSKTLLRWVYDLQGKLLGIYNNSAEVAKKYNMEKTQVNYQVHVQRPYKKKKIIILKCPMDERIKRNLGIPT